MSAKALKLVNGSPSDEFNIERGLNQGDPLSSFLFILVTEALLVLVKDAIDAGFIKATKIGNMMISHLIYADNTIFLVDWCRSNVVNVVQLLECFDVVSRLKINLQKSLLYGVGVNEKNVSSLAALTSCKTGVFLLCI